ILSLASRTTKEFSLIFSNVPRLSDPAAFIAQLAALPVTNIYLGDKCSPFVGLPHSFWTTFLNENLANGSFEWVEARGMNGK
ncbi:hypothetical protein PMAYCL1PPCAC_27485, partial [Pristionchus mayeri]